MVRAATMLLSISSELFFAKQIVACLYTCLKEMLTKKFNGNCEDLSIDLTRGSEDEKEVSFFLWVISEKWTEVVER